MLVLAADQLVLDQSAFAEAVDKAVVLAQQGQLVTFGIKPSSSPGVETAYGYIEASGNQVLRFIEKPSSEKAHEYLSSGRFFWNSGMFCFTVSH